VRRRFFVDEVRNGSAHIDGEEARHLTRVLRVEAGQRYEISDNRHVYLAEIETARKESVVFRMLEKLPAAPAAARIELYAALIKFDRFEWIVEKATELGVTEIVPVEAARSDLLRRTLQPPQPACEQPRGRVADRQRNHQSKPAGEQQALARDPRGRLGLVY